MTDKASDPIEQAEALAGCRWDDPNGQGIAALLGAVAREMGRNPHLPKDDIAAGLLLREQATEGYQHAQERKQVTAALLAGGLGPDDLAALMSTKIK